MRAGKEREEGRGRGRKGEEEGGRERKREITFYTAD